MTLALLGPGSLKKRAGFEGLLGFFEPLYNF